MGMNRKRDTAETLRLIVVGLQPLCL